LRVIFLSLGNQRALLKTNREALHLLNVGTMKLKSLLSIIAALGLGANVASAIAIQIPGVGQDMPKNGTGAGGGNGASAADNFARLVSLVSGNPGLPTPLSAGSVDITSNVVTGDQLLGFEYAVLHYGVGPGGAPGTGGGVAVFYLTDGIGNFTFPANGTGQNGFGGFSGGTLFNSNANPGNVPGPGVTIPDGGPTIAMLGAVLFLMAFLRRKSA
jgi:hypothetical protein